jgi:hypothetical protein
VGQCAECVWLLGIDNALHDLSDREPLLGGARAATTMLGAIGVPAVDKTSRTVKAFRCGRLDRWPFLTAGMKVTSPDPIPVADVATSPDVATSSGRARTATSAQRAQDSRYEALAPCPSYALV